MDASGGIYILYIHDTKILSADKQRALLVKSFFLFNHIANNHYIDSDFFC